MQNGLWMMGLGFRGSTQPHSSILCHGLLPHLTLNYMIVYRNVVYESCIQFSENSIYVSQEQYPTREPITLNQQQMFFARSTQKPGDADPRYPMLLKLYGGFPKFLALNPKP